MKFTSTQHPQLIVHDLGVTFVDGEADVTHKATIEALRGLPSDLGVRAAGGRLAGARGAVTETGEA